MKTVQMILVSVMSFLVLTSCAVVKKRSNELYQPRDLRVDMCLFHCSMCFDNDEQSMLACANDLCLGDLMAGRPLARFWHKACPGVGKMWSKSYKNEI